MIEMQISARAKNRNLFVFEISKKTVFMCYKNIFIYQPISYVEKGAG